MAIIAGLLQVQLGVASLTLMPPRLYRGTWVECAHPQCQAWVLPEVIYCRRHRLAAARVITPERDGLE